MTSNLLQIGFDNRNELFHWPNFAFRKEIAKTRRRALLKPRLHPFRSTLDSLSLPTPLGGLRDVTSDSRPASLIEISPVRHAETKGRLIGGFTPHRSARTRQQLEPRFFRTLPRDHADERRRRQRRYSASLRRPPSSPTKKRAGHCPDVNRVQIAAGRNNRRRG